MRRILCCAIAATLIIVCSGCGSSSTKYVKPDNQVVYGHFTVVQKESRDDQYCYTVYDNNTGVMYYIIYGYSSMAMSPIYDECGKICTYDSDAH